MYYSSVGFHMCRAASCSFSSSSRRLWTNLQYYLETDFSCLVKRQLQDVSTYQALRPPDVGSLALKTHSRGHTCVHGHNVFIGSFATSKHFMSMLNSKAQSLNSAQGESRTGHEAPNHHFCRLKANQLFSGYV